MSINMGRRIKKIKKKELTHIWQRKASVALSKEVPAWRCSHLSRRDQHVQHCWVEYGTDKYKLILKILYISLSAACALFIHMPDIGRKLQHFLGATPREARPVLGSLLITATLQICLAPSPLHSLQNMLQVSSFAKRDKIPSLRAGPLPAAAPIAPALHTTMMSAAIRRI